MLSRKGQLSETMTWTVATIIIIVMIFIFLFFTGLLADSKGVRIISSIAGSEDSGVATQQMLFAILNSKSTGKTVRDSISSGDYASARTDVAKILDDFSNEGVQCDFEALANGNSLVSIEKGGTGKEVQLVLDGREVMLQC